MGSDGISLSCVRLAFDFASGGFWAYLCRLWGNLYFLSIDVAEIR
jgi:hypothetical protein